MGRDLRVTITGDDRSLRRALGNAGKSADSFGSKMQRMGAVVAKASLFAGAAVAGGFVYTLKRGFDELAESQKVLAQTNATIKSTGGVANVTAKDVTALAESLSRMSGTDDEAIQASENLLLTFKNVRNEVGKGNKVFDQATLAALNLSTAGFGSLESASKMMGKALNDPVKGMTALGRAGVTFSEDQKKAIAKLVETGDLLEAQKIILGEVESQVGGSAKAYGETLPGQLAKARNAFDEMAGQVAQKFLPALTGALEWVNANWATISAVFDAVASAIIVGFRAVGTAITWIRGQWEIHRQTVLAVWAAIEQAVSQTIAWFKANVVPAIQNIVAAAQALWDRFGAAITAITRTAFGMVFAIVKTLMQNIKSAIEIITALIRGDWGKAWEGMKAIVSRTLGLIWTLIKGAASIALTAAKAIGSAIIAGVVAGLSALGGKVWAEFQKLGAFLFGLAGWAYGLAKAIGSAIVRGVIDGVTGLAGSLYGKMKDLASGAGDAFRSGLGKLLPGSASPMGLEIVQGLIDGVAAKDKELRAQLKALMGPATLAAIGEASRLVGEGAVREMIRGLVGMQPSLAAQARTNAAEIVKAWKDTALQQAAKLVGEGAVRKMIEGLVGIQPTLSAQARTSAQEMIRAWKETALQKIADAKAGLATAFADAASAALAAFDAVAAAWKSPAEKLLEKMRLEDQIKAVKDAVTNAQAELDRLIAESAAASTELQTLGARPGDEFGDEAAEQKRWDELKAIIDRNGPLILSAQEQLDAAKRARQEFNLEREAAKEREAWEKERERKRARFEQSMADLERQAAQGLLSQKQLGEKLRKLWEQFGIQGQNWGRNFGEKIAQGLRDAIPEIIRAAQEVAEAIKNNTKGGSPTKEGPLSTFDPRDAGYAYGASWAKGLAAATSGGLGAFGGTGRGGGLAMAGGGGNVVIHNHFYVDGKEITDVVEKRQYRKTRYGGAIPSNA